jgi:hypothetical protein
MRTQAELYRFHCANLREVTRGLERVEPNARRAISSRDEATLHALIRLYALLLGAWAECRLKKLLYEPSGFDAAERTRIRALPDQHSRWNVTVEIAFRKRFNLPHAAISSTTIPFTAAARYSECQLLLQDQLRPVIELRNKFAHGQWAYLLNNNEDDVSTAQMGAFKQENLMTLQCKRDLINHLAALINDLVVSVAFDRDFDAHYVRIAHTRSRLSTQAYSDYANRLRARYSRGKVLRKTKGSP